MAFHFYFANEILKVFIINKRKSDAAIQAAQWGGYFQIIKYQSIGINFNISFQRSDYQTGRFNGIEFINIKPNIGFQNLKIRHFSIHF